MARGSKPGERRGGRKKGTPNKKTLARKQLEEKLLAEGVTPLEIMVVTMRDLWSEANSGPRPNVAKRMQAVQLAEKAAPYMHPKLSAMQATGKDDEPLFPPAVIELVAPRVGKSTD